MSKTIRRKANRMQERRTHTRTPGVVTPLRDTPEEAVADAGNPPVAPRDEETPTAPPVQEVTNERTAAPPAPASTSPARAQKAHPRMTLTISTEVEETLQDLVYDELEVTGRMPTLWQFYDRALSEFLPTMEEAQRAANAERDREGDLTIESPVAVYTNIPATTRRKLSKVRNAKTPYGKKIRLAWFYDEAVRRFVEARQAELAAMP